MGIINIDSKTFFVASIFYFVIIIILLIRVNHVLRKKIIDDYKRDLRSVRHWIVHNLFLIASKDIGDDTIKKEKLKKIIDDYGKEFASDKIDFKCVVLKTLELIETEVDSHALFSSWIGELNYIVCAWNVSTEARRMYADVRLFNKELEMLGC